LGTWSKNYWADCEKVCFFLNVFFMSVRILSFNAIHSVIKKMFHKCPVAAMGPARNGIFYFWIFFNQTYVTELKKWTIVQHKITDGCEQRDVRP
jgi:intergrase/recombinase